MKLKPRRRRRSWLDGFSFGVVLDLRERIVRAIDELEQGGEPSVARLILVGLLEDLDLAADAATRRS